MTSAKKIAGGLLVGAFLFGAALAPLGPVKQAQAGPLQDLLEAIQERAPQASKNIIIALLDAVDNFLGNADNRIEGRRRWSAEQKAELSAKVDEGQVWSAQLRADVEAVDMESEEALAEYKALYDEGKAFWDVYRIELKQMWAEVLVANGEVILERSLAIRDKMEEIATKLEDSETPVDVTALTALIRDLSSEIEESEGLLADAVDHVDAMSSTTGAEALEHYFKGRIALEEANLNLLVDGRSILEDIVEEIQSLFEEASL